MVMDPIGNICEFCKNVTSCWEVMSNLRDWLVTAKSWIRFFGLQNSVSVFVCFRLILVTELSICIASINFFVAHRRLARRTQSYQKQVDVISMISFTSTHTDVWNVDTSEYLVFKFLCAYRKKVHSREQYTADGSPEVPLLQEIEYIYKKVSDPEERAEFLFTLGRSTCYILWETFLFANV